jgi:hypothetical protein
LNNDLRFCHDKGKKTTQEEEKNVIKMFEKKTMILCHALLWMIRSHIRTRDF